ncbi:MAG: monovalent cation/H(+) antiporter subunit G [Lachnospiraceae bacterium]|nr:monovalent cation/H(+) antiporter subunit G [Lachnospiraceae bacterium]
MSVLTVIEWIRFIAGVLFLLVGLIAFALEVFGVFKFHYVLNRMHAAAVGDTLGIGASLIGLMILNGFQFSTLKMALVIMFLWCASPVSSHLISRMEAATNPDLGKYCELPVENAGEHSAEYREDKPDGKAEKECEVVKS